MFVVFFILKLLLFIFLTLITLLVLVLALPVTYSGEVLLTEGVRARYQFGWPWKFFNVKGRYDEQKLEMGIFIGNHRLVKVNLDKTEEVLEEKKPKKKKKKVKEEKEIEKEDKESNGFKDILDKTLVKEFLSYLKKVLKIVKPKYLHLKGTYGFEDPALTGMLCGALNIVKTIVPNANINMYPDFADEIFEMDVKAEGRMVVGNIIFQTLRTFLKKDIRKKLFKKR